MELRLTYHPNPSGSAEAVFVRGTNPSQWLKVLGQWNVSPEGLEIYLMPTSLQNIEASGLFIIFKSQVPVRALENSLALRQVGSGFFLPVNAELLPTINISEWITLQRYHRLCFHPSIGLVGFDDTDQVKPEDWLRVPPAEKSDWDNVHLGRPEPPRLSRINVVQPTAAQMVQAFQQGLDQKPLSELPPGEHEQDSPSLSEAMKRGLLKGGLGMLEAMRGKDGNADAEDEGKSMSERLQDWMKRNLDDLEKQRAKELDRLMDLFDKDSDEALKYALPIESKYEGRGEAPPTNRLGERDISFNLRGIGGGTARDNWNVEDQQYRRLREQYQAAAHKALANKDYRKAAYICAHLLADFHNAANALVQGKHYHEAAALYLEHLNNKSAAASCFEKGGNHLKAIELYLELKRPEKAGDLYTQIKQPKQAAACYEQRVEQLLENQDLHDAAEVLEEKLKDTDRAKETFLRGWKTHRKAQACLNRYLDLIEQDEEQSLATHIEEIYDKHVSPSHEHQYLSTINRLQQSREDEGLRSLIRNQAYDLVSKQAERGYYSNFRYLSDFVPEDRLLDGDCSRYQGRTTVPKKPKPTVTERMLPPSAFWYSVQSIGHEFVALGWHENQCVVCRGDWRGNDIHRKLDYLVEEKTQVKLFADPFRSNSAYLYGDGLGIETVSINAPDEAGSALPLRPTTSDFGTFSRFGLGVKGSVYLLVSKENRTELHHYDQFGKLIGSVDCKFSSGVPLTLEDHSVSEMFLRRGYFFFFLDRRELYRVHTNGLVEGRPLQSEAVSMSVSGHHTTLRIAVATKDHGCLLFKPTLARLPKASAQFAEGKSIVALSILSDGGIAVADSKELVVYDLKMDNPTTRYSIRRNNPIIDMIPGQRNQIALLHSPRKLTIVELPSE